MALKIPLPNLSLIDVVCFHFMPEKNRHKIALQVPTNDFSSASTFSLNIENAKDIEYIFQQKNGKVLYDKILLYNHVAYFGNTGEYKILEVQNATASLRPNSFLLQARREQQQKFDRWKNTNFREISALRHQKSKQQSLPQKNMGITFTI